MLHYNFPPFSVGEVKPMRGPARRDVGHGYLAASAIRKVLPSNKDFPYTIRIVADMLESDGSTSMATICGSTMALMQAGVPIKNMVSGLAMGLLKSSTGKFTVLSDISGFEDAFGLMDFKVAGTENGITAIQMDIKYKGGLERSIFEAALAQAKKGRIHILGEMRKCMAAPNPELSALVPKLVTVKVSPDKIGAIIGTGGKVIKEIIAKTNTSIDIDETGLVKIFGAPGADIEMAINWVKTLGGQIEPGTVYHGKIKRLADFGIFVELVPGLDGLVHVSNIPRDKQRTFVRDYKIDDMVTVEVIEYDESTGRVRLRLIEK
jgi:polyribonucleotide nucleotidyltransferase